jgi:hypothetical protein
MDGFFIGQALVANLYERDNIAVSFCIIKPVRGRSGLLPPKKRPVRIDKSGDAKTQ